MRAETSQAEGVRHGRHEVSRPFEAKNLRRNDGCADDKGRADQKHHSQTDLSGDQAERRSRDPECEIETGGGGPPWRGRDFRVASAVPLRREPIVEIRAADVIRCLPGHKHWHGATPTTAMTHIAVQEALDGKNVMWMEKVTDDEYMRGPASSGT
ncbi:MAG TPA: hypothetical protein VGH49_01700 [Xanthobacteraceae bacterium]|jgi:hypothetical protein